jgi:flavin reductase (DIM6/NTAB) family NADH-FMN oxidoreductase RutF
MHTVLVSCIGKANKPNVTTVAWAMPTSINPPLLAISLAPTRHSHTLIEESGEFTVISQRWKFCRQFTHAVH